jgi:hypothetical protein
VDQGIYAQIDGFCRLGSNWDGEDAPAVTKEAADRARVLLREVLAAAQARGVAWQDPTVAPTPDGGIDFSWEARGRWVMLSISPSSAHIECASQKDSNPPEYREQPTREAIETALWAIAGAK